MKNIFNYKEEIVLNSNKRINVEEASIDDVFNQYYCLKKSCQWFAMKPIIDFIYYDEYFNVGSIVKLSFRCLPFSYKMRCVKCKKNKYLEAELFGRVSGNLKVHFIEENNWIYLNYVLSIKGINKFIHWYYILACYLPHDPYMRWRLNILKKQAIIDTKSRLGR